MGKIISWFHYENIMHIIVRASEITELDCMFPRLFMITTKKTPPKSALLALCKGDHQRSFPVTKGRYCNKHLHVMASLWQHAHISWGYVVVPIFHGVYCCETFLTQFHYVRHPDIHRSAYIVMMNADFLKAGQQHKAHRFHLNLESPAICYTTHMAYLFVGWRFHIGLLPDTQNCGLRMRREYREYFPRHRGLVIPRRTCHDACRDRWLVVFFEVAAGKTFPAFTAHAQSVILRIWYEVHGVEDNGQHWFKKWLSTKQAPSHQWRQCWLIANYSETCL